MKRVLAVLLVAAAATSAFGYVGATVSAIDNDNAVANATVFQVPAAAGMAGAQLLFDNSAQLSFSPTDYAPDFTANWVSLPLVGSGVTIHGVNYDYSGYGIVTGVNDAKGVFTNTQATATDPRFPTNIPRVGRDPWEDYTAVQFVLDNAAHEVGAFIAMNTNRGTQPDDNNILMQSDRLINVAILGESDTLADAQYVQLAVGDLYAPFIKVTSNGTDPIKAICIVQDAAYQSGAPFGFFDVYATPEPATMALMAMGLLAVVRRRRA